MGNEGRVGRFIGESHYYPVKIEKSLGHPNGDRKVDNWRFKNRDQRNCLVWRYIL